jgi:hypothetical protein
MNHILNERISQNQFTVILEMLHTLLKKGVITRLKLIKQLNGLRFKMNFQLFIFGDIRYSF